MVLDRDLPDDSRDSRLGSSFGLPERSSDHSIPTRSRTSRFTGILRLEAGGLDAEYGTRREHRNRQVPEPSPRAAVVEDGNTSHCDFLRTRSYPAGWPIQLSAAGRLTLASGRPPLAK